MRILVCGSRDWTDQLTLSRFLRGWLDRSTVLIHGAARGADTMAGKCAQSYLVAKIIEFPANWDLYGKAAGPIRNTQMLDAGQPDMVIAFTNKPLSESRGTANMVKQARERGLPVYIVEAA